MRRAQGGLNAAVLVAVIAGLIILYILFLPDAEREALLENKSLEKVRSGVAEDGEDDILLREFPGRIDIVEGVVDKQIPNIFLFEKTDAEELERINPIVVRNGWFDKKERTVSFGIDGLEDTNNVILSFKAKEHEGTLTIKLNNEIIYESDIETETVAPIRLKRNLLYEDNTFHFSVSSVGFGFWKTNEYSLEDIKVVGDITDKSRQESKNIFTLTSRELFNIERADLRFIPYCRNQEDVGILDIEINSRNIFSAVPVCEDKYRQTIPLGILDEGQNKVIFKTNKGSYSVEQIKMELIEKETTTTVYFFEVNESIIKDIEDGNVDVVLTIEFIEGKKNKRANLDINGRRVRIDQERKVFTKTLNDDSDLNYVEEGNNFIEIEPIRLLNIVEIKIGVQQK